MEKPSLKPQDAIVLLESDHKKVKALFMKYEKLANNNGPDNEKSELVSEICSELRVHTQIEEEIFYPEIRKELNLDDLLDEAEVEHASAKDLISQLEAMQPQDDLYDAKVHVLYESIEHHIKEEEDEMFPKVKKSNLDLAAIGNKLSALKHNLQTDA